MRKYLVLMIGLLVSVMFYSCSDNSTTPETPAKGSLYITSTPSGAQIWSNGTNTNKVTPDSLTNLDAGTYSITLKSQGLNDTTFTATVSAGQKTTYNVRFSVSTQTFTQKIYETIGTSAQQPSGLQLSTGQAYGISSSDKSKVDLYYSSNGFVVASADLATGLSRQTYFKIGSSTNFSDTVSAPVQQSSWAKSFKDTETNYVFVYDNDQHYSKLQITNRGGGTPGNPAWVEVKWIYNKQAGDRRFQ